MTDEMIPGRARSGRPGRPPRELARDEGARDETTCGKRLTRRKTVSTDAMHIDPRLIRPGESLQWVRRSCYGKPDPANFSNMTVNHWTPVQAEDRPEFKHLGSGAGPDGAIQHDGLVLCSRPKYLTDEAIEEGYEEAQGVVGRIRRTISDTPDGTLPRRGVRVHQEYEPLPDIPGMDAEQV